jgi:hypothetical protein
MHVGVGLPTTTPGADGALIADWARVADRGPFSSVAVLDRLVYDSFDPFAALSAAAAVTDIVQLASRAQMRELDAEHVWTDPLVDMRFNYRPENPLYLLLVRAYRLGAPVTVENTPAYAGCKSWVPLDRAIEAGGVTSALNDDAYVARRHRILQTLSEHA